MKMTSCDLNTNKLGRSTRTKTDFKRHQAIIEDVATNIDASQIKAIIHILCTYGKGGQFIYAKLTNTNTRS